MLMFGRRGLLSVFLVWLVIGLLSGCANSETNSITSTKPAQESNQLQEDNETGPAISPQSEKPKATDSPSVDGVQNEDKVTDSLDDKKAEPTTNPKQTNAPKTTDQNAKPTATPSAKPAGEKTKPTEPVQTPQAAHSVTISIVADEETGTVLAPTVFEIKKEDTVLDVLKKITRKNKIQMEYRGVKGGAYIEGIDNIYEFDFGAESGWMYKVNDEFPNKGAGVYKLKDGDVIEWVYTVDLGGDVGAEFNE